MDIRKEARQSIDYAVKLMYGTDKDSGNDAETREAKAFYQDLKWVQASTTYEEFLERGQKVYDKWMEIIAHDPEYSDGYFPSWINPWEEFKWAFKSEKEG
jgi:hypothetical protein